MKCELERGRRICPCCNVRHIGRCQEDVDRWRIREILGDWCPCQGGEGFDGCVEWENWEWEKTELQLDPPPNLTKLFENVQLQTYQYYLTTASEIQTERPLIESVLLLM